MMIIKLTEYYNGKPISIEINKMICFGNGEGLTPTVITINGEIVATVCENYNEILKIINNHNRRKVWERYLLR